MFSGYYGHWCFLLRTFLKFKRPASGVSVQYLMLKKIALALCFTLSLGLLSGCSPSEILRLKKTESSQQQKTENIDRTSTPGSIGTPIALPPRFNDGPLKPGQTSIPLMPNGLPALKPMKGINVNTLFTEKIKNSGERFERVENAVIDIRTEFETYKPAIVRLAAVESDIQNLIKELEVLLQETPSPQRPTALLGKVANSGDSPDATPEISQLNTGLAPPKPVPIMEHKSKEPGGSTHKPPDHGNIPSEEIGSSKQASSNTPPPSKTPMKGIVALNFRTGEYSDKLRVAFDTNKQTPFTVELDNDERLIIIDLPQARWKTGSSKAFPDSALIETLNVEPTNGGSGTMIILSLRKDTQILQQKHLSPDNSTDYHRIYFDLKM